MFGLEGSVGSTSPPKSGCMPREEPIQLMKLALLGSTGALLMSVFHQLSRGNSGSGWGSAPPTVWAPAGSGPEAAARVTKTASTRGAGAPASAADRPLRSAMVEIRDLVATASLSGREACVNLLNRRPQCSPAADPRNVTYATTTAAFVRSAHRPALGERRRRASPLPGPLFDRDALPERRVAHHEPELVHLQLGGEGAAAALVPHAALVEAGVALRQRLDR